MSAWNTLGRGDIDLLAFNLYLGGAGVKYYAYPDNFENQVVTMLGYFGSAHSYVTEFSLNAESLDAFSTDEAEQAAAISSMIDYMRASGVTRANFFCYLDDNFGARKGNGTYRKLWDSLREVNVVGGIADLPDPVGSARATAESSRGSPTPYAPIAGAAAAGLFAFAAGAWYFRRRWRAG
jgi:hypothetical protein